MDTVSQSPRLARRAEAQKLRPLGLKRCTGCDKIKPLAEFPKQKDQPDGCKPKCRPCVAAVDAANQAKFCEKKKANKARYYRENAEKLKRQAREAYYADPARCKERVRQWQARNPEKKAAYGAKWTRENLRLVRENVRRRYARRKGAASVPFTVADLNAKRAYWGDRCWMCGGEPDSWDHVKPLVRGGAHVLSNLRPSCRKCNSSKGDRWPL